MSMMSMMSMPSIPSIPLTATAAATATATAKTAPSTGGCYGGSRRQQQGLEPYPEGRRRDGGIQNFNASYWSHPVQVPPHSNSGDDASSDDHDSATTSKDLDLDPMVTLSELGYSQELVTTTAPAAGFGGGRPLAGGGGGGGGATMSELPRQGSALSSSGQYHEGLATDAFGSNTSCSSRNAASASGQGETAAAVVADPDPADKAASSFAALEAAILDDDEDDDDGGGRGKDRDKDWCGSDDCGDLEGKNSADLPEVASLETYSQLAETEEALAAGNFLEATFDMMERRRVVG